MSVVCLALSASPMAADTRLCDAADVSVTAENTEYAALVCNVVTAAADQFPSCALPALADNLRIDVVDALRAGCFGLYHCDENRVEVLAPPSLEPFRDPIAVFAHLSTEAYFQSIVMHELAHAATDGMPCSFDGCVVEVEYIAHVMQVMSLEPDALRIFEQELEMDQPVSTDTLNPLILFLVPEVFAQNAWKHFNQQDDPCGFIGQLVSGQVLIDTAFYNLE